MKDREDWRIKLGEGVKMEEREGETMNEIGDKRMKEMEKEGMK